ncbi:MAG: hypothetical protein ACJ78X_19350 [Myxococcales bacterium]
MSVQVPARAASATTAPAPTSGPAPASRVVIATRVPGSTAEDGLARVSWGRTLLRLAVEPGIHPWTASWRLRRRAPLVVVAVSVLLLLLFALSGCASAPTQSVRNWTPAPRGSSNLRCESVLVSQEVQIPPTGDLADLRVTIEDIPRVLGKLRVLVRHPRFAAGLSLQSDGPAEFDKVLEVTMPPGQTDLTVVLTRPGGAPSDWPRGKCRACRVDIELTGLFGAQEGVEAFFINALKDASAIETAFATQAREPASRPSPLLRRLAGEMSDEARRCGAPIDSFVGSVADALSSLDSARARLYAKGVPPLPDAKAVFRAWDQTADAIAHEPVAANAARAMGWPSTLRGARPGSRLATSALNLELVEQIATVPAEDQATAALWVALALSPDQAALDRNVAALPPIRDLADAEARLAWVDPRPDVALPIPGLSRPASLRVREWRAARHGRKCIGRLGAAPVHDPDEDARIVAQLLGADSRGRLPVARATDVRSARSLARSGKALLCEAPAIDPSGLFQGLEDKELGQVAQRLDAIFRDLDVPRDESMAKTLALPMTRLYCKLFDVPNVQRHVSSFAGYKLFVEGGTHLLQLLPEPLVCDGRTLSARDIRQRLRDAYRTALDRHAIADRLCTARSGKCPEEVAASVRRTFALARPQLAAPAPEGSKLLDFPPPFGFSEEWVSKLDRCGREACESLALLRNEAPAGQFEGPICSPRLPGEDQPQEVAIRRPEAPSTVTLSSCDAHMGVRLTLHRFPDAGTLVAIASSHQFRYGSETVQRLGRHPQLGRIYQRVADLADPSDVSRRSDDVFEVALTPTVENQVFYFFSLRRRDY